ncbi:MAG: Sua5/YciO/YrdC/YwlC family protein, partial [Gemmatimonadaceae bacterium]
MQQRRLISIEGVVQGVGFRPYVHRLAAAGALRGFVRNDAGGVLIDVEGDEDRVDEFCRQLTQAPPTLATIARLEVAEAPLFSYSSFEITPSDAQTSPRAPARVPPDVGTCEACLAELFDPSNRRFGHPFITCTDCGPRFTVLREAPYDRERTTMSTFPLCARCQHEYDDPRDRRFHAETIACPECGPALRARTGPDDAGSVGFDAVRAAAAVVREGGIVAIKALGGFHLACDATNAASVNRLRERKRRPAKPFAIMVRNENAAADIAILSAAERATLASSARPVILLTPRPQAFIALSVAPRSATLGVMLPSTPIHHLLLAEVDRPLVMTSGN